MIPPERKLIAISVEMVLADVVEGADDAALQKSEVAFHRVDVIRSASIFLELMADGSMPTSKFVPDAAIHNEFIGHNPGILPNMFPNCSLEILAGDSSNRLSDDVTIPFDQGDNRDFFGPAPIPALFASFWSGLAADISFIYFDNSEESRLGRIFLEGVANSVGKEP